MASEKEIIQLCKNGDNKAMQWVYEKYRTKMMGICLRYSRNSDEAKDLVQEGFIKAFTNFDKIKEEVSLEGWLVMVIRNNAINIIKKQGRLNFQSYNDNSASSFDEIADENETYLRQGLTAKEVMEIMNKLPEKYRLILFMYAVDGLTHKEISEVTGMAEGASKSQLSRARKMLVELLKNTEKKTNNIRLETPFVH